MGMRGDENVNRDDRRLMRDKNERKLIRRKKGLKQKKEWGY